MTLSRKRKTVSGWVDIRPEVIELDTVLNALEINLDQLICIGILVGTDYNPKGIPRIGQKKALDLVKKHKTPVMIFKAVEEQMLNLLEADQFDWQEIFHLFKKPKVTDVEIEFPKISEGKIKEILVTRHGFSEERVEKQLDKLRELKKKASQKELDKWF